MTIETANLTNQFLVAMPGMADPTFAKTVTYLCQHGPEGALGIIINRPSDLTLGEVMEQMSIEVREQAVEHLQVYFGGPVHRERGFVLHEPGGQWDSTMQVSESVALTTSRDILEAIGSGNGPSKVLVALGYAGWGKGQLEREILENAWLNVPADMAIMFESPARQRWKAAAESVGVDISLLTASAGHA
ncbi:MAG: YqgE/AlgH family protein [Methylotetracoccus sp.]|jgi:putative transcriptional regulator|nr:YqgE/AlgH family protein [Methylotetracoccus sp.]